MSKPPVPEPDEDDVISFGATLGLLGRGLLRRAFPQRQAAPRARV
jgi:hypothetical protein